METMMMSSQDSGPAWYHYSVDHEEATGVGDGGDAGFLEMFGDLHSSGSGDLFELVWQGGGPAGRSIRTEMTQAGGGSLPSSSLPPDQPPSEDEMAAWLYAIVRGDVEPAVGVDKPACGDVAGHAAEDDQQVASVKEATKTDVKRTEDTGSNCSEKGKQRGRRSYHSETHNLIEKRRRWKINEKFKTLQQLVPGCDDKSNQNSTLEQTIKYMKSLQHQIQAMSFGCRVKPASVAVYYPAVVPPPYLPPPQGVAGALPLPPPTAVAPEVLARGHVWPPPPALVPFATTLPLLPYPAVMVPAAPMQQYPAAAAPNMLALPAMVRAAAPCQTE